MDDILLLKAEEPAIDAITEAVAQGYGLDHPQRIHGFAGSFAFYVPDVYVTPAVQGLIRRDGRFRDTLLQCLARFRSEDYGCISDQDAENNNEQRYLCGTSSGMVAAYPTAHGTLHFAVQDDKALFSL